MIFALIAAAFASPPVAVDAVEWAQPFTLDRPARWTLGQEPTSFGEGWLVQLRAPVESLRPTAVGQRVLYGDTTPAMRLSPPLASTCALVVVPGTIDARDARWFFGSTTLPEQLDAPAAAKELQSAVDAGIKPMPPQTIEAAVRFTDLAALNEAAQGHFANCSAPAASRDEAIVF